MADKSNQWPWKGTIREVQEYLRKLQQAEREQKLKPEGQTANRQKEEQLASASKEVVS